jgi:hypothetical protein
VIAGGLHPDSLCHDPVAPAKADTADSETSRSRSSSWPPKMSVAAGNWPVTLRDEA